MHAASAWVLFPMPAAECGRRAQSLHICNMHACITAIGFCYIAPGMALSTSLALWSREVFWQCARGIAGSVHRSGPCDHVKTLSSTHVVNASQRRSFSTNFETVAVQAMPEQGYAIVELNRPQVPGS